MGQYMCTAKTEVSLHRRSQRQTLITYTCTLITYTCTLITYTCTLITYTCTLITYTCILITYTCIVCLVTLKIGKTIPKKSTGYQIYFLIIFILRTD